MKYLISEQSMSKNGYVTKDGFYDESNHLISKEIPKFIEQYSISKLPVQYKEWDGNYQTVEIITYIELLGYSDYSIRQSIAQIPDMVSKSEIGIGLTDNNVGYGLWELNQECIKQNKKSILGSHLNLTETFKPYVLAKNKEGYLNLIKLLTYCSANEFENIQDIDFSNLIIIGDYETYRSKEWEYLIKTSNDLYLTIYNTDLYEDDEKNQHIINYGLTHQIPIIMSNHFYMVDNQLDSLNIFRKFDDNIEIKGKNHYIHNSNDMMISQYTLNTLDIYNKIEMYNLKSETIYYPDYKIPKQFESEKDYLLFLIKNGLAHRFGENLTESHIERVNMELEVIENMGYIGYFLIVADFINYAKRDKSIYDDETIQRWNLFIEEKGYDYHPIAIGPSRGSVAGSLIAYVINITDINPLQYDLLFERFLNKERVTLPDIDTDIPDDKRAEIIDYVKNYYNQSNSLVKSQVSGIAVFGTYKLKQLLRTLASKLYDDPKYGDVLSKLVSDPEMTLDEYIQQDEVTSSVGEDNRFKQIIKYIPHLQGCVSNLSQHAAGYVIGPTPITDYMPTVFDKESKEQLTAYTDVESLGLLKMDFLGLRSMTIINDTIREINNLYDNHLTITAIQTHAMSDYNVYETIKNGYTLDLFQLSSSGMTEVVSKSLMDLGTPNTQQRLDDGDYFSRIIAGIAMYRPGPMAFIDTFVHNALNPNDIVYPIEDLKDLLRNSYGLLIYQESIIQLLQKIAGFSLGAADVTRRAIGKKDKVLLDSQKELFINGNVTIVGGLANGYSYQTLENIWKDIETFASYGFNKSHAVGYAYITMTTAWLSTYFPSIFAVSNLNNPKNKDSIKEFLDFYKQRGIKTIPAGINTAESKFTSDGHVIQFGLQGIKNLASKAPTIHQERMNNGNFIDLYDFLKRMARNQKDTPLNKSSIQALIYSGVLDEFFGSRESKLKNIDKITGLFTLLKKEDELIFDKLNIDFFNDYMNFNSQEMDLHKLLKEEYNYTGHYISGHPVDMYQPIIKNIHNFNTIKNIQLQNIRHVDTMGVITSIKRIITKKKDPMAFVVIEDNTGSMECVVFPNTYKEFNRLLNEGDVVVINGTLSDESSSKSLINSISTTDDYISNRDITGIQITVDNINSYNTLSQYISIQKNNNSMKKLSIIMDDEILNDNLMINFDNETITFIRNNIGNDIKMLWSDI